MTLKTCVKTVSIAVAACAFALVPGVKSTADTTATFVTCVGGASGMTLTLKAGSIVRGCAPKIMDQVVAGKTILGVGTAKQVYANARMKSTLGDQWSELQKTVGAGGFQTGEPQLTGDKSNCEIEYIQDPASPSNVYYSVVVRADSVIGARFVVNREGIYKFEPQSGSNIFVYADGSNAMNDPAVQAILADINTRTNNMTTPGIPIEGGLTECYLDSAWRGIDEWNNTTYAKTAAPQLDSDNFRTTQDNLLSVVVLAVLYNKSVTSDPLNVTTQMERLITGGYVDNWDAFFAKDNLHMPLMNYYREPLSGTAITYKSLIMRGVKQSPSGASIIGGPSTRAEWDLGTDFSSVVDHQFTTHKSGIPGLDCLYLWNTAIDNAPGSGAVLSAVDWNRGGHGYTFLQRFTNDAGVIPAGKDRSGVAGSDTNVYGSVRVAMVNGYSPYSFTNGNSLPGVNGVPDVNSNLNKTYFQNVVEGKYPLWTYNHCFTVPNHDPGLDDFIARFKLADNAPTVRDVGLIPLTDMTTEIANRDANPAGSPNAGRGPAWSRCGFYSPITGEFVRDGMMMMQSDPNGPEGLPGEPYVEMRP